MILNDSKSFPIDMSTIFYRLGQCVLWLTGILAVAGRFWRAPVEHGSIAEQVVLVMGLAVWVGILTLFVRHFERKIRRRYRMITVWIPAMLFLFAVPRPWLYLGSLFLVSFLWQLHAMFFVRFPERHVATPSPVGPTMNDEICENEIEDEEPHDENTRQQIVRSRTGHDTERLEGTFWVEFAEDQWTVSVHVPFCPAFEGMPKIKTMLLEGDAKLNVFKTNIYGVRIDVKKTGVETTQARILVIAEGTVSESFA